MASRMFWHALPTSQQRERERRMPSYCVINLHAYRQLHLHLPFILTQAVKDLEVESETKNIWLKHNIHLLSMFFDTD